MQRPSEIYPKLYHYTTWPGLLGILKTQSFWATHYKFLNDYSEIVLFRNKLIEFLLPYVYKEYVKIREEYKNAAQSIERSGGIESVVMHDTIALVDAKYKALGEDIYITSFCGTNEDAYINENGLLSQWRGYGEDGGFAIVLNTKAFDTLLEQENNNFDYAHGSIADLIYSDDEETFKTELSAFLLDIAEHAKEIFSSLKLKKETVSIAVSNKAYHAFVSCICRYKHRGFKEENEVRIFVLPAIHDQEYRELAVQEGVILKSEKERKFREKMEDKVPYIDLFNFPESKLPIEQIIVGPHKNKELRAAALRVMLRNTDIDVKVSDIPYISSFS